MPAPGLSTLHACPAQSQFADIHPMMFFSDKPPADTGEGRERTKGLVKPAKPGPGLRGRKEFAHGDGRMRDQGGLRPMGI